MTMYYIKETGEIVNLASSATITLDMCDSWGKPIDMKPKEIELIQDKANDFDWESFRAEAAKDILAGILAHANICISEAEKTRLTKLALSYTEKLIRQLKEKEEK